MQFWLSWNQDGLDLRDPAASVSLVLKLNMCTILPACLDSLKKRKITLFTYVRVIFKEIMARCGGTYLWSQHLGGRGR